MQLNKSLKHFKSLFKLDTFFRRCDHHLQQHKTELLKNLNHTFDVKKHDVSPVFCVYCIRRQKPCGKSVHSSVVGEHTIPRQAIRRICCGRTRDCLGDAICGAAWCRVIHPVAVFPVFYHSKTIENCSS